MRVYRICRTAHRALDGEGARRYGGRWNEAGWALIYTSSSRALAALELLVHIDATDAPDDLILLTVELPDDALLEAVRPDDLPARWGAVPEHPACVARGTVWARGRASVGLRVPAAPIPEEENVLLNVAHPDFERIAVVAERRFTFHPRLLDSGPSRDHSNRSSSPSTVAPSADDGTVNPIGRAESPSRASTEASTESSYSPGFTPMR